MKFSEAIEKVNRIDGSHTDMCADIHLINCQNGFYDEKVSSIIRKRHRRVNYIRELGEIGEWMHRAKYDYYTLRELSINAINVLENMDPDADFVSEFKNLKDLFVFEIADIAIYAMDAIGYAKTIPGYVDEYVPFPAMMDEDLLDIFEYMVDSINHDQTMWMMANAMYEKLELPVSFERIIAFKAVYNSTRGKFHGKIKS